MQQKSLFSAKIARSAPIIVRAIYPHGTCHQAKTMTRIARRNLQKQNAMLSSFCFGHNDDIDLNLDNFIIMSSVFSNKSIFVKICILINQLIFSHYLYRIFLSPVCCIKYFFRKQSSWKFSCFLAVNQDVHTCSASKC